MPFQRGEFPKQAIPNAMMCILAKDSAKQFVILDVVVLHQPPAPASLPYTGGWGAWQNVKSNGSSISKHREMGRWGGV